MMQIQPQATPQRRFLELSIVGGNKKLYIPSDSVLTFEDVPEGKNPTFPDRGSFLRYDFGEGLSFAIVNELVDQLKEEIGTDGFIELSLIDDAALFVRDNLIVAIQEKEDEGLDLTQLSLTIGGQMGSLLVKDTFEEIKAKRGQPS